MYNYRGYGPRHQTWNGCALPLHEWCQYSCRCRGGRPGGAWRRPNTPGAAPCASELDDIVQGERRLGHVEALVRAHRVGGEVVLVRSPGVARVGLVGVPTRCKPGDMVHAKLNSGRVNDQVIDGV